MINEIEKIESEIESLALIDEQHVKNSMIENLVIKISALLKNSESSHLYHLLGLCWYKHETDVALTQAENAFEKSVKLNNKNLMANIYLCHCYFDQNKYASMIEKFCIDDFERNLQSIDQNWRYLKLKEMELCCNLYLDNFTVAERDLITFIELCEASPEEDLNNMIELKAAYQVTKEKFEPAMRKKLEAFVR